MKTQIEASTAGMFAQAVALAQNGRMKSTIHVGGKYVFIKNMDNTLLMRYKSAQVFEEPFSFFANDYESPRIRTENGQVVFITHQDDLKRTKACAAPKLGFHEVKEQWGKHEPNKARSFVLTRAFSSLLDEGLSHIEISKSTGAPVKLLQRDIYSGAQIQVESTAAGGSLLDDEESDAYAFAPIGIRTVDFQALFVFADALTFHPQDGNWLFFEDMTGMQGILATCLYDELGFLAQEGK